MQRGSTEILSYPGVANFRHFRADLSERIFLGTACLTWLRCDYCSINYSGYQPKATAQCTPSKSHRTHTNGATVARVWRSEIQITSTRHSDNFSGQISVYALNFHFFHYSHTHIRTVTIETRGSAVRPDRLYKRLFVFRTCFVLLQCDLHLSRKLQLCTKMSPSYHAFLLLWIHRDPPKCHPLWFHFTRERPPSDFKAIMPNFYRRRHLCVHLLSNVAIHAKIVNTCSV